MIKTAKIELPGAWAKAWSLIPSEEEFAARPDTQGSLIATALYCPQAHTFWNWWYVSVVHLHPIEGAQHEVVKYSEGATHEFAIYTLNPDSVDDWDPDDLKVEKPIGFLTPPDVLLQFEGTTEEWLGEFVQKSIEAISEGRLSPDSDFRQAWTLRAIHHFGEDKVIVPEGPPVSGGFAS